MNALPEGKVALVTGSSRGIGRAIAEALIDSVDVLLISGRDFSSLEFLQEKISKKYPSKKIDILVFDIAQSDSVETAFREIYRKYKRLDILVNNAGIMPESSFMLTSSEALQQVFATNTFGTYYCSQYAARLMARNKAGVIINISSVVAQQGAKGLSAYSASKAAIDAMTRSLAKELGAMNIRVNAVSPGLIDTALIEKYTDIQRNNFTKNISLGRLGDASDIATLVKFLVSDQASYISGQVIAVDGQMRL